MHFPIKFGLWGDLVFMPIASLYFHYNKKEEFLNHSENTHLPEMEQMALNSLIDAWHPQAGLYLSKVTSGTHTAEWDVQHNTGFHSPIRVQAIHIPIISSALGSGIYMLKFLR